MPDHRVSADRHERIFGKPEVTGARPGRRRYFTCSFCGGEHERGRVPHNCRPAPPKRADLSTPMTAPPFEPFRTSPLPDGVNIDSRSDKREYMARHDLVEWESGVAESAAPTWAEQKRGERELIGDIKRFKETDTDYLPDDLRPERLDERGSLDAGTEIEVNGIEVVE